MALRPPMFLNAASGSERPTSEELRLMLQATMGHHTPQEGVVGPTSCAVSDKSGTDDMSVDIAAGPIFIKSTENDQVGLYFTYNDAVVNLAVPAANPTNPRKDLVICVIRDSAESGASDDARFVLVQGTAAASPVEPDPAAAGHKNYYVLAMIDVPALDTAIGSAQITDRRRSTGPTAICASTAMLPANPFKGQKAFLVDTNEQAYYDGAKWEGYWKSGTMGGVGNFRAFQGANEFTINSGTSTCRYKIEGRTAHVQVRLKFSAATGSAGALFAIKLPPFLNPRIVSGESPPMGIFHYYDSATVHYAGTAFWNGSDISGIQGGSSNYIGITPNVTGNVADEMMMDLVYELATA